MAKSRGLLHHKVRICTKQVACDGANITRPEADACGACRDALERRARASRPLRGERLMQYEAERRVGAR
jgi:hypothetical protein